MRACNIPCDSRAPWYSAFSLKSPSLRAAATRFEIAGICTVSISSNSARSFSYPVRVMGTMSLMSIFPIQIFHRRKKFGPPPAETCSPILCNLGRSVKRARWSLR